MKFVVGIQVPHVTHTPWRENKEDRSQVDEDFVLKIDIPNERLELALTNTVTQTKKNVDRKINGENITLQRAQGLPWTSSTSVLLFN